MAATTQPTDFSDLYTALLNAVRMETGITATENQAKRAINVALHDMHIGFGEHFPWATRRATLVTQAPYSTGTLSINQGDTVLTGSGTAWNTNNAFGVANMRVGGKITIASGNEVYEIATVTNDTTAALTTDYIPANASGAAYSYFEDEYALATDFLRPINQRQFSTSSLPITLVDREDFEVWFPQNNTTGTPFLGAIIDLAFSGNATPRRRLRLAPPPSSALMIPYNYVTSNLAVSSTGTEAANLSADTDQPIIPLRYRYAIVLHGLATFYRDKRDDERAEATRIEYVDMLNRIVSDTEIGAGRPRVDGPQIAVRGQ